MSCADNARNSSPKRTVMNAPSLRSIRRHQSGSAILAALAILAVTMVAVGAALFEASHRFRASHQSTRWAQAAQAAEAGAEIALMTAQKYSWSADGWSGAPGAPGASPVIKSIALDAGVPGAGSIVASMAVDTIDIGGSEWLRIRAKGIADLAGGARAGIDPRDVLLRKLSLKTDRDTGSTVTSPQATRTIEILARSKSPFDRAVLLDKELNMSGGGWIDSFDSSDPTKSTSSLYDIAKRQSNGHVDVNDTRGVSDLAGTYVYGNVAYSGPAILNTNNVQGTVSAPFSKAVRSVSAPGWTIFNPLPTIINNTATLTGGTPASPALYKVSSVNISGGKVLTLAPHAVGVESYAEIWVSGNFTTSGDGYILQQPGVHVTYHIEGDITVSGSSFDNQSNVAGNNIIEVVSPPAGVSQTVTVSGTGALIGAINAPGADFTLSGATDLSGAVIGKTMNISVGASIHYDEALANMSGSHDGFSVRSWTEAVR